MNLKLDAELIQMLRCPVTGAKLGTAPTSVIENLNRQIENGAVKNREGERVAARVENGFINEDQSLIFPVRGGIIILIVDEAIAVAELDGLEPDAL
jgi:uncharacterized protein YbaR (Trm112 family)